MTLGFMPQQPVRRQPTEGLTPCDIMIVGSQPDGFAIGSGRPFAHAAETIINNCLHQAGLIRAQVFLTNFIWDSVKTSHLWKEKRSKNPANRVVGNLDPYKQSLWALIKEVKPRVIVPLGDIATYVLTKRDKTTAVRGYPFTLGDTGIIVVPSLEPGKMVFSNHEWRWYLAHDLRKARKFVDNAALFKGWADCKIVIPSTFGETIALLDLVEKTKLVSWDIEVSDFHTSCMGFGLGNKTGVTFPIDMRWSEQEEQYIWIRLARILENPAIIKIVQNGVFDVQFMAQELGIFVQGYTIDTMVSHHIMYPDFKKSLEFLASIHTNYPYWKDELEIKSIKEEN
jgi:uracil-DNA glycosylase family 4